MGIARAGTGYFDIDVEVITGSDTRFYGASEYSIDEAGLHFVAEDGTQHFVPHQNIKWLRIREHDEGEW